MHLVQFVQRYPPARGGSEAYTARLCRWLAARGHHVLVATTTARDLTAFWDRRAETVPEGVQVEDGVSVQRHALSHLPAQRWILRGLSLVPFSAWKLWVLSCNPLAGSMRRWAQTYSGPLDAVLATAFPYGWPLACARLLARRRRVPLILTPFLHLGDLDRPDNRVRRGFTQPALADLARQADRVLAQTPQEHRALLDLGIPSPRVILQGLAVDPDECTGGNRQAWRHGRGFTPEDIVVGHLANLSAEKGSNDLVIASRGQPWRLVLAGPVMPNFRPDADSCLLGELSDSQRRDFFAGIDLFALPSVVDSFGLVLLEAMANGVPCVGYHAGGIPGVITAQQDGLITACDPLALRAALRQLTADSGLRNRLGQQARRTARATCWEEKLRIVEQTIEEAIIERRHGQVGESGSPGSPRK